MFSKIKKVLGVLAMPALLLVGSLALAGQGQAVDGIAAAFNQPLSAVGQTNAMTADGVKNTIEKVTNIFAFIVIGLSVIFIIIGAFQWMTGKEKEGKEQVKNAIIGLVIAICAYFIVKLVSSAVAGFVAQGNTVTSGDSIITN